MSDNNPIIFNEEPNLIRTSSLDPNYIRRNLSSVNTPVKLLFERNSKEMTEGWSPEEVHDQRRLVKFDFERLSPSDYLVRFKPIEKLEYANGSVVVSCIFWEEKELYIVTSVDIILLLENLIQESFTIEEKNRVRRNLQSLKPYTISRSNKNYQRFFQLLMSMEDPRPRNIEKDIKVFKWTDLFTALSKVISKYSSNNNANVKVENESDGGDDGSNGKFNQTLNNNVANFSNMNTMNPINSFNSMNMNTMNTMNNASHNFNAFDLKANANSYNGSTNSMSTPGGNSSTSTEDDTVLHPLKYKPKKKKMNQDAKSKHSSTNKESPSLHNKHQAFKDGIKPSNPVPMKSESTQTNSSSSHKSSMLESSPGEKPLLSDGQSPSNPNLDNMEVDSSDSLSMSGGSSGTYALSSSDDVEGRSGSSQLKNSNSADGGSIGDDIQSSNDNMNAPAYTILGPIQANGTHAANNIPSRGVVSSASGFGSADSNSHSGSDSNTGSGGSGGSALFSNRYNGSDQNTGLTSVGESIGAQPPKRPDTKTFNNINNFAQDQSNRIFGSMSDAGAVDQNTNQTRYYQYPEGSQMHYNNGSISPSFNGPLAGNTILNPPKQMSVDSPHSKDVKLPSLEEYFHSNNKPSQPSHDSGVKLAPLMNNSSMNRSEVSDPKSLVEYSKERSTRN